MSKEVQEAREVEADREIVEGVFEIGRRYYVRTPTYQYLGTLEAVTGTVFVLSDCATVYETGDYKSFFAGKGKDVQPHVGAGRTIIDRGGTVLHEMPWSLT